MCILFMYVSNSKNSSKFKFILASNRDEKFSRPSKQAHFWSDNDSKILAGQDLQELGTWLGVSKTGKLATLLNIMGPVSKQVEKESISRGGLVTGFLRSSADLSGCTYLRSLCQDPENFDISTKYKPFHLITIDLMQKTLQNQNCVNSEECQRAIANENDDNVRVTYLSNSASGNGSSPKPQHISPPANSYACYAFGNSPIDKPLRKVTCGQKEFENLVVKYTERDGADSWDSLVEELLQFLRSTEKYFPDEALEERAKGTTTPVSILPHLSSRFVAFPEGIDYGTRAHTIITVDSGNNLTFLEWTKENDSKSPEDWKHSVFRLNLNSTLETKL